jgi:hypothetical protein
VRVAVQDDAGSPGSGGASPYHRAAAPMMSPPMELAGQSNQRFVGAHVAGQDDAGSPGSGEPHPTRSFALAAPGLLPTRPRNRSPEPQPTLAAIPKSQIAAVRPYTETFLLTLASRFLE